MAKGGSRILAAVEMRQGTHTKWEERVARKGARKESRIGREDGDEWARLTLARVRWKQFNSQEITIQDMEMMTGVALRKCDRGVHLHILSAVLCAA